MSELNMCETHIERGDTTTKTQYNGGHKLIVLTTFELPEGTWRDSLMMTEYNENAHIHHHQMLWGSGPNSAYKFSHSNPIDGVEKHINERENRAAD